MRYSSVSENVLTLTSLSLPLRWLVYAHPFFQGVPRVLEVGGYTSPEAWGVDKPYVGSLHPLKIVSGAVVEHALLFIILLPDCLK